MNLGSAERANLEGNTGKLPGSRYNDETKRVLQPPRRIALWAMHTLMRSSYVKLAFERYVNAEPPSYGLEVVVVRSEWTMEIVAFVIASGVIDYLMHP